jgi:hypothetical protein
MLDTCLCFPREMEPGYCLYLPILTMVVLQARQMEQVVMSHLAGPGGERIMDVVPRGTELELQLRRGVG